VRKYPDKMIKRECNIRMHNSPVNLRKNGCNIKQIATDFIFCYVFRNVALDWYGLLAIV